MKTFNLKTRLIFFLSILIASTGIVYSQPIISGTPNTQTEICPSSASLPNNVYLQFNFGGASPANYFIQTIPSPLGCSVLFNISNAGMAVLQFSDKTEKHEFKIYNAQGLAGTYTFNKIKTLQGIKAVPAVSGPFPVPNGYDGIIIAAQVGQCKTSTFRYDSPPVYYKNASGVNFGSPMLNYEWVVPKNWKVFNTISDGVTPIITSVFADITPDPFTTGEFKIRALNTYCALGLSRSEWFKVALERPVPNFPVVSNVTTLQCGNQPLITFSVQNVSSLICIGSYTWNIGTNWLLPNGSPAPAIYSTGTSNSVTLIPACGRALGTVSATITANGYTYSSSNAASVAITQPAYSISGVASICSGSTNYTFNGLVCNSTLAWTVPPSYLATLSSTNASPITLTWGGTSGNIPLTANVTSCAVTTPVTLPIHVGPFTSSDYSLYGNNGSPYWCANQSMSFGFSGNAGSSAITWSLPTGWTMLYNGGAYIGLRAPAVPYPSTGTLSVSFTEPCGTIVTKSTFLAYSSTACNTVSPCYSYSPNPSSSYINVNVVSSCIGTTYIKKIELVSASSGGSVYFQDYSYGTVTSTTVVTSGYPNGVYYLRIYDGNNWSSYTINILH